MENIEITGPRQRSGRPNAPVNSVVATVFRPRDNVCSRMRWPPDLVLDSVSRAVPTTMRSAPAIRYSTSFDIGSWHQTLITVVECDHDVAAVPVGGAVWERSDCALADNVAMLCSLVVGPYRPSDLDPTADFYAIGAISLHCKLRSHLFIEVRQFCAAAMGRHALHHAETNPFWDSIACRRPRSRPR